MNIQRQNLYSYNYIRSDIKPYDIPEKPKVTLEKRIRLDRFGKMVIDRQNKALQSPFDPLELLPPTPITDTSMVVYKNYYKSNFI